VQNKEVDCGIIECLLTLIISNTVPGRATACGNDVAPLPVAGDARRGAVWSRILQVAVAAEVSSCE